MAPSEPSGRIRRRGWGVGSDGRRGKAAATAQNTAIGVWHGVYNPSEKLVRLSLSRVRFKVGVWFRVKVRVGERVRVWEII